MPISSWWRARRGLTSRTRHTCSRACASTHASAEVAAPKHEEVVNGLSALAQFVSAAALSDVSTSDGGAQEPAVPEMVLSILGDMLDPTRSIVESGLGDMQHVWVVHEFPGPGSGRSTNKYGKPQPSARA